MPFLPKKRSTMAAILHVVDPWLSDPACTLHPFLHPLQHKLREAFVGPYGMAVTQEAVNEAFGRGEHGVYKEPPSQPPASQAGPQQPPAPKARAQQQQQRPAAAPPPSAPKLKSKGLARLKKDDREWRLRLGWDWTRVNLQLAAAVKKLADDVKSSLSVEELEQKKEEGYKQLATLVNNLVKQTIETVTKVGDGWH